MKVVLDTNVLAAAFITQGLCHALLELCLERHEIVVNDFVLNEFRETLKIKMRTPQETVEQIASYLLKECTWVETTSLSAPVCRDKDDDFILALADAAGANYIISGDRDLLDIQNWKAIKIVTPREFWELEKTV